MRTSIDEPATELILDIARVLTTVAPSAEALSLVQRQLLECRAAAATETVIEGHYPCINTAHLQDKFGLAADALPACIN
jgi:hypothetical protein